MARMNPRAVLEGEKPRLIDEWQKAPDIWNQVRDDLDVDYQFGKYILTGSSTPADKTEIHHSGAGRITPVKMRPMSLWESKESKGTVSLSNLFDGGSQFPWDMNTDFTLDDVYKQFPKDGELFQFMKEGYLWSGAYVIVQFMSWGYESSFVKDRFFSTDDDTSVYVFIRKVTGDNTYTKEYVDSLAKKRK